MKKVTTEITYVYPEDLNMFSRKNEISIENIDINNLTDISISDKAKVLIYNDNNGNRKLLKSIY